MSDGLIFSIRAENRFQLDPTFLQNYVGRQPKWGPVGFVTYTRTYSRRLTPQQRGMRDHFGYGHQEDSTEEFWETAARVVDGAFSILKQQIRTAHRPWDEQEAQEKAQEMYRRMWAFKFLPPGRGLWFMGTEALQKIGSAALNNCGFVSTENIASNFSEPFCMLMDYLMLGVGMGFDVLGAGKVIIQKPVIDAKWTYVVEDSREGWVEALRIVLDSVVGKGNLPVSFDFSKVRPEGAPLVTFGGTSSGPQPLIDLLNKVEVLFYSKVGQPITSGMITDVQNLIGKCVVAGNVRRSSEIALGYPHDKEFTSLKDPTDLIKWSMAQAEIAKTLPEWQALETLIQSHNEILKDLSVLDAKYLLHRETIDQLRAQQKEICSQHPKWMHYQEVIDAHPLRTHRWASNNTVLCDRGQDYSDLAQQTVTNGEPGYAWMDVIRSRGRLVDPPNHKDRLVKGFNPCGEQPLWDKELCNLVETFPTNHESLDDYLQTLKYAYLYAKIVTLVPTHNSATNAIVTRNRRIGTSMAGVFELYCKLGMQECIRWWEMGYQFIRELDAEYSGWMGVGESIKVTTIKPGGTVPLLPGIEGGMKVPSAKFYMRTIRIDYASPLIKALREAGYRVEKDLTTPRTMVAYFPVEETRCTRTAEDVGVWEQAAIFTALQRYWSDNMVSATLTFRPEEAKDIANVLQIYEGQWKCTSFLPLSTHGYAQAPYIPCTQQEYMEALTKLKPLALEGVGHEEDEKYCSSGVCELPQKVA